MSLNTDFSTAPYYDDFDENKNFYRVLFKPGVAVQARELTQLQTILQNQVERFGNNILINGTIIDGCNFTEIRDIKYAKILDLNTNGQPIVLSNYHDMYVYGATTGIKAQIQTSAEGLESDGTDLKTIFFKYLTSGTNTDIKTFNTSENLIITNNSNTIIDTVTVAGGAIATPAAAVGSAYAVRVSNGIIYQKGFFTAVNPQLAIVSKYSNKPNNVVVGFITGESVIDNNVDTSLLDNANGFNNYQAPGADRLKLTPVLTVKATSEALEDDTFFAIQEYMDGRVVRRNNNTQYNKIMDIIESRTKDESGNYTVNDFNISISNNNIVELYANNIIAGSSYTIVTVGNTNFTSIGSSNNSVGTIFTATATGTGTGTVKPNILNLNMGAGVAYVEGKRVELLNKYTIDLPKATESNTAISQNITTNYGNYVLVREYMGKFDFHKAANVNLYDTVTTGFTSNTVTPAGNKIGQASIASIILDNGTPGYANTVYRMYLFNIKMNSGKDWKNVKSIAAAGNTGIADLNGNSSVVDTTIYDQSFKSRIFLTGSYSLKSLPTTGSNATYISRTSTTVNIVANTITVSTPTGAIWPYGPGASLNSTQKKELLLIAGSTSGAYTANKPIDLTSANVYITNSTSMSISSFSVATLNNNTLYHNIKYNAINSPTQITLDTVYVKINCSNNAATSIGPWSLGIPNVYSIEDVWVNTGSYAETNSKKSFFVLNNNQQSDFYGLSTLSVKPGSGISSASLILVKLKVFKKNSTDNGFYSVSSYPIDDISTSNTAAITSNLIPTYKDSKTVYALRDTIDFRPYAVNTAAYAATSLSATVNPSATNSFQSSNDLKIPAPNEAVITNYDYYLGRKDLLFINEYGDFAIKEGVPSVLPKLPSEPTIGMVLAELDVPPYPSLGIDIIKRNHLRYTMKDVNDIDQRLQRVEYYTALNLLESNTKNLIISDSVGNDRFKNGIFVDDFQDLERSDLIDPAWSASIIDDKNEIVPYFVKHPLKLKIDSTASGSNVTKYRDILTLSKKSDQTLIEQPYATAQASTVTNIVNTNGKIEIYPSVSYGKTTTSYREWYRWRLLTKYNYWALPNTVNIRVSGLKANTKYYVLLNNKNVIATPAYYTDSTTQDITTLKFGYGNRIVPNTYFNSHWSEEAPEVFPGQSGHGDYKPTDYWVYTDNTGLLLAQLQIYSNKLPLGSHTISITEGSSATDTSALTAGDLQVNCSVQYQAIDKAAKTLTIGSSTFLSSSVTQVSTVYTNDAQPFDYLSQTFKIDSDVGLDSVIFLDKLDLYFATKPLSNTKLGVTVEIMNTVNELPDPTKTLCSVYIPNNSINANTLGAIATTITLNNPIALKTNSLYALTIIADQHNPNFAMCTAVNGNSDRFNTTKKAILDSFTGKLYTGTNGKKWNPVSNEALKFKLYNAAYNKNGYAYLTNRDHEFFTINDYGDTKTTGDVGTFNSGDNVVLLGSNTIFTLSVNSASKTAVATSKTTNINAGDYIAYWTKDSDANNVIDVVLVNSVFSNNAANTTTFTLDRYPQYSNTAANMFKTRGGNVSYHDKDNGILHLIDSTVYNSYYFSAGDKIIDVQTGATANIVSVDDLAIGAIDPNISETNYTFTATNYTTQILKESGTYADVATGEEFTLTSINNPTTSVVIPSTSREYSNGIAQGFRLKVDLKNTGSAEPYESTPSVDATNSVIDIWEYSINNDATGESGLNSQLGGNALSRYISSNVTLAENLDAEDIIVYLTAYRPPNSDLKTYVRFKNKNDNRDIYDVEWTELVLKANTSSSSSNLYDYRELEYRMPSVANDTALVSGNGAALDISNGNILTYKDIDGAIYTGYKDFAIKVVFLTSNKKNIPRIKDIRAIALT